MATYVEVFQGNQIGGCVTVITCTNGEQINRIMIDYGASLPGSEIKKDFEYPWDDEPVDAVFFTHYHGDHVGRLMEIPKSIPLYMGDTARRVMINIQEALSKIPGEEGARHQRELEILNDDARIHTFHYNGKFYDAVADISNFRIEPYSVDHSAYDAYMFLLETPDASKPTGKKVILHTGDFRGHGRRGTKMLNMIKYYVHRGGKRDVDILITEGTMMNRLQEKIMTEPHMQKEVSSYLKEHKYAFLICSSTNLDSLASFYQAAQDAAYPRQRYMYTYSTYYAKQLLTFSDTAGGFSSVYQFKNVHKLNLDSSLKNKTWDKPKTQKELMDDYGFLAAIKPDVSCEIFIDAFLDKDPVIIYSMWDGYLNSNHKAYNKEWDDFLKKQEAKGIEVKHMHTSGHATSGMLAEVIKAVNPQEEIIPMHTENPKGFELLDIGDELKVRIRK